MKLCTNEHHGYFSLDMSCLYGCEFDNTPLLGKRFSLTYIATGSGTFLYNGQRFSYDAPVLLCINEKESIAITNQTSMQTILFHPNIINTALNFDTVRTFADSLSVTEQQDCFYLQPFVKRTDNNYGILFLNEDFKNRIQWLFDNIASQITLQDNDFWACRSRSYLIELLSLAYSLAEEKLLLLENQSQNKNDEILCILSFLKSNMHQKITISDLTRQFHLNRTDLSKRFSDYTGETVISYLNKMRIDMAATMLRDTKIPIPEIMERVGFQDYSYFSNTFKKQKGISPRNYRKQYCWMK